MIAKKCNTHSGCHIGSARPNKVETSWHLQGRMMLIVLPIIATSDSTIAGDAVKHTAMLNGEFSMDKIVGMTMS